MEFMTFVKKENVHKAEEVIRSDFDLASKQSLKVKDARSLGLEGEGSFFYITGSDEGVEKCKELIKEFIEETSQNDLDKAKEKIKEEEDAAAAGMGGIFG